MNNTLSFDAIVTQVTPILLKINAEIKTKGADNLKVAAGIEGGKICLNKVELLKKGSNVKTLCVCDTVEQAVAFLNENNIVELVKA